MAVEGTPLEEQTPVDPLELVRMVATARILMPHSRVRLSAGRETLSQEAQILCLQAGADSIFYGETPCSPRAILRWKRVVPSWLLLVCRPAGKTALRHEHRSAQSPFGGGVLRLYSAHGGHQNRVA